MAWFNKGQTADNVGQARALFDRALAADPGNVEALIGSARADVVAGAHLLVTDSVAALRAAEAKLTKALSSVPDHALGHMILGLVNICTKRGPEGIADCEHALALDRNLAHAHALIGLGKVLIGRAEETEALANSHLGRWEQAAAWYRRSIESNRNYPQTLFRLAAALAQLGRLNKARSTVKAGLGLNPTFTISRFRAAWTAMSDDPTYLAQLEPLLDGMRKAGDPE
jgi:tetratricopeptide (TPR) repeat protein